MYYNSEIQGCFLCCSSGRGRKCNLSSPLPRFCWVLWVWQSLDLCRFLPLFYFLLRTRMTRCQEEDKHNPILPWVIQDHYTHKQESHAGQVLTHKCPSVYGTHALNTSFPSVLLNSSLHTDLCEWYTTVVNGEPDNFTEKHSFLHQDNFYTFYFISCI